VCDFQFAFLFPILFLRVRYFPRTLQARIQSLLDYENHRIVRFQTFLFIMAAKDAAQKDKESQKEQIYYSDTYKDVRLLCPSRVLVPCVRFRLRKCTNIVT
jgi:hypothetical protein